MRKTYFNLNYNKVVLLVFILLFGLFANAQTVLQWAKGMGGSSTDFAKATTVDASGNVYTTGYFTGVIDFDPGVATFTLGGTENMFISKLDANGNFVWAKVIGGFNSEIANSIAVDASGNVYTTGYFTGTVDFDPGVATNTITSQFNDDIFILKLDVNGNFVWVKVLNGVTSESGISIALDAFSNIYTTGYFTSTVDFNPGPGTNTLTSAGSNDVFVLKLSAAGNYVWAKAFGGVSSDQGNSIAVDGSGNVYTTGIFYATADFDPGVGTSFLTSAGDGDIFISKLDATGNFIWAKRMGTLSSGNDDEGLSIALDASNNVYTSGYFRGTVDFDPGVGTYTLSSGLFTSTYVSKLDVNGNFIWANAIVGSASNGGYALALDASANVHVVGEFGGTADFDPGIGNVSYSAFSGSSDVFLLKLSNTGNFIFANTMGGNSQDFAYDVAVDNNGSIYMAGGYSSIADFDPNSGISNLTSLGSYDIFVLKLILCIAPLTPTNTTINQSICSNNTATLSAVSGTAAINWYATATSTTILGSGTNFISPILSTGTYTYYVEGLGCVPSISRAAITVTVKTTPTVSVNSGTICSGNAFVITPSGANTYTIQGGSSTVSPLSNTSYTVNGTSAQGCISANTATSTVTVNALPTISVNSGTICNGNTFTIVPSGASTYTISGSSAVVNPTFNTSYNVTGTSSLGCISSNTAISSVTVNALPTITALSTTICAGATGTLTANGANTYTWNTGSNNASIFASPVSTTTYTVNGTSSSGCVGSAAIATITIGSAPIIIVNSATVCAGSSAILNASGVSSYTWNTGANSTSIVVTPTINTTYTVSGNLTGCSVGVTNTASVLVNALPTINAVSSTSLLCVGQMASLTASGAITYTWSTGGIASIEVISPSVTATYTVNGTDVNGCTNSATVTQPVSVCTSNRNSNKLDEGALTIYPNPNNGSITIEVENPSGLQIVDVLGKIVLETKLQSLINVIDISQFFNGVYYFKIKQNNSVITKKIIKN